MKYGSYNIPLCLLLSSDVYFYETLSSDNFRVKFLDIRKYLCNSVNKANICIVYYWNLGFLYLNILSNGKNIMVLSLWLLYLEFSIEFWTLGPLTWKYSKRVLLWKLNVAVHCNAFKCSAILNSHQSIAIINQVECSGLDEHLILILA